MIRINSQRRRIFQIRACLLSLLLGFLIVITPLKSYSTESVDANVRRLSLYNTHTGEKLDIVYWDNNQYQTDSLKKLNHFFRDFRCNEEHEIDRALFDQLFTIWSNVNSKTPIHIISGYRSTKTNDSLARQTYGVAKNSYHTQGKAVDFKIPECPLEKIRDAALSLKAGGVGYYPRSGFIHIDTGRVRQW